MKSFLFTACLAITLSSTAQDNEWAVIDATGKPVSTELYSTVYSPFSNGYAIVMGSDGTKKFVDEKGAIAFDKVYKDIKPFIDGIAAVRGTDGYWRLMNTKGEITTVEGYDEMGEFSEGSCYVKKSLNGYYIDKTGKEVVQVQWAAESHYSSEKGRKYYPFKNGFARDENTYITDDGTVTSIVKYRFIDKNRKNVFDEYYIGATDFSEGKALVRKQKYKKGMNSGFDDFVINTKGKRLFTEGDKFTLKGVFKDGFAACVLKNQKQSFVNESGDVKLPEFEEVRDFSDGMAAVKNNGKWGFINTAGTTIIELTYNDVADFSEGMAAVNANGSTWSYIDKTGKEHFSGVVGIDKSVSKFNGGYTLVKVDPALVNPAKAAENYFAKAKTAYADKQYETAVSFFTKATTLDKKYNGFYEEKATSFFETKKYKEAIEEFQKNNKDNQYSYKITLAYIALGNKSEAIKYLQLHQKTNSKFSVGELRSNKELAALANEPTFVSLVDVNNLSPYDKLIEQGNIAFEQKEYKKSIDIYTTAITLQPKQSTGYRLRGVSYLYDGNYESAETNFNKAIRLKDAKAWNCYYMKGQMQNAQQNYRRATQLFDSAFVLNKDWQIEYEVAMSYFFDGQKDKAIAMQTKLANTTESVNDQHVLAAFLLNNGDAKQAEDYNSKVLQAFNKEGKPKKLSDVELKDVLVQRADIFSVQKNYSISSIFYKQVIDLDPSKGEYYYKYAAARANWFGALNSNQQQGERQAVVMDICKNLSKAQELNYNGNYEDFKGLCDVKRTSVASSNTVNNNGPKIKYLWYQVAHMSYPSDYYNVDYAYVTGPEGLSESQVESVIRKSKFRLGFVVKETRVMKCTNMDECNKQVAEFNKYYSVGGTRLGDYEYK